MQPEHRIDELIVDLSFTTTRLARHEKALLSDWLTEDLLPALDQLFSHYSPGQQVLRFEALEFDFGNLTNRNYQHRIREQLLQKFAQLLQTQLLAVVPAHLRLPDHATSGDHSTARLALTQLFNYLASGQLSAHQPVVKQTALHEQLLDAVIAQHDIAELLRELPQRDVLIQRLLTQFSVPQRLELLRQLAPQHIQDTSALLDLLQLFESDPLSADAYRVDSNVVWQALLQLGLEYPQANVEFWLRHIFRAVSAHAAIDSRLLQHYLTAIKLPFSSAATLLINLQTQIAQLSAGENVSTSEPYFAVSNAGVLDGQAATQRANLEQFNSPAFNPAQPDTKQLNPEQSNSEHLNSEQRNAEQFNTGQLRQLIAAAFIRADASQLQKLWPQLIANEQQLLVAALTHYLPQAEIRQQLMLRLPLDLQADIIALLVPALKEVFLQLQTKAGQLIELLQLQTTIAPEIKNTGVTDKTEALTGQTPEWLLRQLWEITLGLIFNNQSEVVNTDNVGDRNFFVMALAARYADLHNLDANIVQQAVATLINQPQMIQPLMIESQINQSQISQPQVIQSQVNQLQITQPSITQPQATQPQATQHTRINPVDVYEPGIELHGNVTASNEQQPINLETEFLLNTTTAADTALENAHQKNLGLEKINQTSNSFEANNYRTNSHGSHSDENYSYDQGSYEQGSYDQGSYKKSSYEQGSSETSHYGDGRHEALYPQAIPYETKAHRANSSDANSLSSISDHQLFDLCLRLKSGALAWQSLANDIPLLQRLISSYIRLGHSATAENCADFVAAINGQAESSGAPSAFYLAVLQALIADKLIDLDAITLDVKSGIQSSLSVSKPKIDAREEINTLENQSIIKDHAQQLSAVYDVESRAAGTSPIAIAARPLQLDMLAVDLQQRKITPESLNLAADQFAQLVDIFIAKEKTIAPDIRADLIAAIHQQALQAIHKTDYYRRLLSILVHKETLDLVQVCEQVNQQNTPLPTTPGATALNNIETIDKQILAARVNLKPDASVNQHNSVQRNDEVIGGLPLPESLGFEEYQAERIEEKAITTEAYSHQSIDQERVPQFPSQQVVTADTISSIVQALLTESAPEQRLQALQLDFAHWQGLLAELIQQTRSIDKDASTELLAAVQRQARRVINFAHYYRLVVDAVIAHKPIDLEAFTRAANSANEPIADQLVVNSPNPSQPISSSITSATDVKSIAQTLLTEPQVWERVQTLQFGNKQWETLATELIQQATFSDHHAATDLLGAVQTQARLAIAPAVFYRLVIQAVLHQQPIDLEAFAATATDIKQILPIHGEYNNVTTNTDSTITVDNFVDQTIHQPDAGQGVAKELNAQQFNTAQLNANQLDTFKSDTSQSDTSQSKTSELTSSQINVTQFSSGDVSQNHLHPNDVHPNHVNPDQAMDYPLLTGSDNSLRKPALSLAQLLAAELPLNQEQLLALQQHINALLNRSNAAMMSEWCELLANAQHAQVLIYSVPAHLLHQIAMRLHAGRYPWLDAIIKLVMEALALLVTDINNLPIKQAKWKFIFNYLFAPDNTTSSGTETSARALELSIALCEQLASAAGIDDVQRLVNLTQRRIALLKPPAQQKPAMRLQDITSNPATHSDATTPQWEAGLHINNAGQVLAAAFLPRLFSMLNLLQDGKFVHLGAADRAVHLVQFMVTGQSATPEYELILNKILCGISTSIPVSAGIEISEQEQTLIEQMLTSMIQHWKVLGSTSITGLRETFFQRQGWLVLEEDCWRLKVKEQTFDLLLDRLPWSISLIKHGWMDKPLRVSWRNHS